MLYKCERCGYETTAKSSILSHLKKKKICPSAIKDIDRTTLLNNISSKNSLQCQTCHGIFKNPSAKCRHMKLCNPKSEVILLNEHLKAYENRIQTLEKEIENLRNVKSINHIQNIQNNTFHITNNFCDENIDHISDKVIASCIVDMDMPRLLEQIHFHPEHPENHTIKMKNTNKKWLEYYEDGCWKVGHCDKVLEDMINSSGYKVLRSFYSKNADMVNQEAEEYVGSDSARKLLNEIDKWFHKIETEDEKTFKELKDKLFLVVLNGTAMVCQRK